MENNPDAEEIGDKNESSIAEASTELHAVCHILHAMQFNLWGLSLSGVSQVFPPTAFERLHPYRQSGERASPLMK